MERLRKIKDWLCRHWKDVKANWRNTEDPMKLGLAWSKGFIALLVVLALVPYSSGNTGWEFKFWTLLKSPPNEIGDTLAGIAGALAFLWIIVTVQLQSKELAEQRKELKLAREEYAKMAEAQGKQVELMASQAKIFEDEQLHRLEVRAGEEMRELVQTIYEYTERYAGVHWKYITKAEIGLREGAIVLFSDWLNDFECGPFDALFSMEDEVKHCYLDVLEREGEIVKRPSKSEFPEQMLIKLKRLEKLYPALSAADKEKFDRASIWDLANYMEKLTVAKIWSEDLP
ncbi:hypothetical protein [Aliiroseovarius crassostreae]|uniref:hypothetical protein n=1 Tax=Aliiroseovarius crassostreae TaxID=154981 RepID=UPI002205685B|nr:hypothetical protein [Aliiroseovarius crassostreae]UWP98968.1 hypothetical protein K3X53_02025 [Aliiroseovarius crassostreae]